MADTGKLKRENTALLRQAMQNGSAGKNDLARLTHLSFPTVSRIVDEMVERGEAQEIGTAASTGGRCAMQYRLNPQYRLFLCLRLEQDTLHWFVCDLDGTPLEQEQQTCSGDVRELLDTLLMRVRARYPRLAAVVLGFAGTMHNGIVTESFGYPELRGVSLSAYLRDKTGLPCMAARDMQVVAAGYAAQYTPTPKAVVCIYIGKLGAGAGIVLDGKVWGGAAGFAGELHYLPIKHNLEYAQNHFAGADMSDYFTKVICGCAALINPDRVVLYADSRLADKVSQICVVLMRNYSFEEALVIVREMTDNLALDLFEKGLVTSSLTLWIAYDHRYEHEASKGTVKLERGSNSSKKIMDAVEDLYLRIADRYTGIRRIEVCANRVAPENYVQYSLFDDPKQTDKERHLQEAVLNVKQRYGKNAIMRGSNLLECSTYRERNEQIGGHRA